MFRNRGKKQRRWFLAGGIGLVALAVAATLLLRGRDRQASAAVDSGPSEAEAKALAEQIPVELAQVVRRDMPSHFSATGALQARRSVDLVAKVGGQVQRVAVEEGKVVAAGDVLLEIDWREQELLTGKARVMAQTAQRELERVQGIAERGLATDKELEAARRDAEVAGYEYQLAVQRLADHTVRAPFAGVITSRHAELGQTIPSGTQLFQIADNGPMELRLHLPETLVDALRVGQAVAIAPDAGERSELRGEIERIAPAVDPATSTIKVTVRVPANSSSRSGSFVRARITTDVHSDALAIPKRALVAEAGAQYVFLAQADSVVKVEVQTGYADADHTEVLSGLSEGDRVVVVGHGGLRHGSRIRDLALKPKDAAASETAQPQVAANED
jgi:RND family efflux transporter MFP subunit